METHLEKISARLKSLVKSEDLSQSILITGEDGIGKFKLIIDTAAALLCRTRSGCGKCPACKDVYNLRHPDFLLVFPFPKIKPESRKNTVFPFSDPVRSDAKYSDETRDEIDHFLSVRREDPFAIVDFDKKENIPVEVIKDLVLSLAKKPLLGGRRVAAVLNVDKMAFGAADLFLKVVEEPPANTHIILSTANPNLLLPTLLSRTSIFKVNPAKTEDLEKYLTEKLNLPGDEASYIARMSRGSPGLAMYLSRCDLLSRRNIIFSFFEKLPSGNNLSLLIEEVSLEYVDARFRFNDIKTDFEIMESIIHDLYLLKENQLDYLLINIDIAEKLRRLEAPPLETLDVWKTYCGETKKACLVNNVSINSAMVFFYISAAEAIDNPAVSRLKLP